MADPKGKFLRFGAAMAMIVLPIGYLAWTGVEESKSYYVTISEMHKMDDSRHAKRLRVAGNVQPGSIKRQGTRVEFVLVEEGQTLPVVYKGTEAPPDTFRDDSQALVEGQLDREGVFRANHLQAKCASKYAPQEQQPAGTAAAPGTAPAATEVPTPASN